jgi:CheY-like chemotaxis protein
MSQHLSGESTTRQNFKNAKLLIVEDNLDHRIIIKKAVEQCLPEIKPILVPNKEEALDYLTQCLREEWESPKLIILDLYMPTREDGWELLDQIRALPATLSKIPIVLLSYSSDRVDIAEAYKRGCSSYLVKPSGFNDWIDYFQTLRMYWWETVTLPKIDISLF